VEVDEITWHRLKHLDAVVAEIDDVELEVHFT
jgi:hypothetical protein